MKTLYIGILVSFFIMTTSNCQEYRQTYTAGKVIYLNDIPDNSEYLILPVEGITWKLIGFGNAKTQSIDIPESPPLGNQYTVLFKDNDLTGITSSNHIYGKYEINVHQQTLNIIDILSTRANEERYGHEYYSRLSGVNRYDLTPKGLKLYYTQDEFLLFEISKSPR